MDQSDVLNSPSHDVPNTHSSKKLTALLLNFAEQRLPQVVTHCEPDPTQTTTRVYHDDEPHQHTAHDAKRHLSNTILRRSVFDDLLNAINAHRDEKIGTDFKKSGDKECEKACANLEAVDS